MRGSGPGAERSTSVALSVHGPRGVLDLLVPAGASMWDVAREYAERSGLGSVPLMYSRAGVALPPDLVLADGDIAPGTMLVATTGAQRPLRPRRTRPRVAGADIPPGPTATVWFCVAAAAALLAGWLTAATGTADLSTPSVLVLLGATVVGVVPVGRYARLRALTAPVFAGAAAYALLWDPDPLHQPAISAARRSRRRSPRASRGRWGRTPTRASRSGSPPVAWCSWSPPSRRSSVPRRRSCGRSCCWWRCWRAASCR